MDIGLPEYAEQLFLPRRYKVLKGGRGSSKSQTVGRCLLLKGRESKRRILCTREFQNSIAESVHQLLSEIIDEYKLNDFYKVTDKKIIGKNGTEFLFKGLRHNVNSIKSMQGVTDVWIEEAHTISKRSWDILIPTVREDGSEFWVTYNPEDEEDPTHAMFHDEKGNVREREDALVLEVNWRDNPWFPEILRIEKDYLFEVDPDLAEHVWEGQTRRNSDAQIFRNKWSVEEFEVDSNWAGPYLGADWGFSVDPTVMVECYIDTNTQTLYVRREAHGYHVELEDIPALFDKIPCARQVMSRGDNSRPETISYVARKGFPIESCSKWPGSVEDGIEFLRTFRKIVIHTDCPEMKKEARYYSYKVDRLTDQVTTIIVDANNHCWDAVRYALQDLITAKGFGILSHC